MAGGLREVNLEQGLPPAAAAIKRLTFELQQSRRMGCSAVKIIHGYGSSGTGGRIRLEARRYLRRLEAAGEIQAAISGEEFTIFNEATRAAFLRCPELRKDRDLERHNNGITMVVL